MKPARTKEQVGCRETTAFWVERCDGWRLGERPLSLPKPVRDRGAQRRFSRKRGFFSATHLPLCHALGNTPSNSLGADSVRTHAALVTRTGHGGCPATGDQLLWRAAPQAGR